MREREKPLESTDIEYLGEQPDIRTIPGVRLIHEYVLQRGIVKRTISYLQEHPEITKFAEESKRKVITLGSSDGTKLVFLVGGIALATAFAFAVKGGVVRFSKEDNKWRVAVKMYNFKDKTKKK